MIKIEHLTKCYNDFKAVSDLSIEIEEGHVYGFLGPNGAGKTTTMSIMTGCLSATSGRVEIDGHDIFEKPLLAKKLIGYLPEQPPLYMSETPLEYLQFVGEAKGIKGTQLKEQIDKVLSQTKIEHVKDLRISTLSKGYKQRVGIAQALLGNPKVIILDEPTVGLDPMQIIEIRDLIKELGKSHTVIFSSHILSEVQEICDRIVIIAKGNLVAFDTPENLNNLALSSNEIIVTSKAKEVEIKDILSAIDNISDISIKSTETKYTKTRLQIKNDDIYSVSNDVFFAFAKAKTAILEMTIKKASLEDVFIQLTEDTSSPKTKIDTAKDYESDKKVEVKIEDATFTELENNTESEDETE